MALAHAWNVMTSPGDVEKTVSLSSLRPDYDVQMGSFPPEREMNIEQLLHPAILKISDQHLGLKNSYVAKLYEMREYVKPEIVTNNGDRVDLQALEHDNIFCTIEALCLQDQSNWLQSLYGVHEVNTEGNHDQKFILASRECYEAGINIFPGIRIQHPDQRDVVQIHGHHFDSPTMVLLPMRIAAGIYDDMVSRGADGAAAAKIVMKILLDGLGYEGAYKNASHQYDANLDIGHLHLLKILNLQYEKEFSVKNLKKDVRDFAKNSLISSVLWFHRTGGLETLIKTALIPAFREAVKETANSEINIETRDGTKSGVQNLFTRVAVQMLPVLEKDPGVSLLEGLSLKKLRPLNRKKTPTETETGAKAAEINVYGCWIDGRSTFGATYANGVTYSMDWMKVRKAIKESRGLPDEIPSGNDLVIKHLETYGGFHPKTLEQFKLFMSLKGVLSDEDTREHSRLPDLKEMPTLKISRTGEVEAVTPTGQPLARARMPEEDAVIRPHHILHKLMAIDPRTANDLRERMETSPALKKLLEPAIQRRPLFQEEVYRPEPGLLSLARLPTFHILQPQV